MHSSTSTHFLEEAIPDHPFKMIQVVGGRFMMGSEDEEAYSNEKPVHKVELSTFFIAEFPVTQALWEGVMGDNPSYFQGQDRPVEQVSWEDCQEFIEKLNHRTKGGTYRLPTEAEWEFAAKGGNLESAKGYQYAGGPKFREVGWYWENSHRESKPVGMKAPNALGLFDMSGNVDEWVQDLYAEKYYEECIKMGVARDPEGPRTGTDRVLRGGSWGNDAQYCRVSDRARFTRDYGIGFRLAFSPSSEG